MIDANNKISHHFYILIFSVSIFFLLIFLGFRTGRAIGAIPFFLLFLVMAIGPTVRIWPSLVRIPPKQFPWALRGELGIWFVVWSIVHIINIFYLRNWEIWEYIKGMSPWAFGAFVAVFMGIILAVTSSKKAINFLGFENWKWLQSFAYVIFWLTAVHVIDRALLRPGFLSTDWLHRIYLLMIIIIPVLQITDFIKKVLKYKKTAS